MVKPINPIIGRRNPREGLPSFVLCVLVLMGLFLEECIES